MKINDLVLFFSLAFILSNNIFLMLLVLVIFLCVLLNKKREKIILKEILTNIAYGVCIVFLNSIINLDLGVINFIYFACLSMLLYFLKIKIKVNNYCDVYLIIILLVGGVNLWGSF